MNDGDYVEIGDFRGTRWDYPSRGGNFKEERLVEMSVSTCWDCGALVEVDNQERHNAWHDLVEAPR